MFSAMACSRTTSTARLVNAFDHDPEDAVRVRIGLLRELAAAREPLVAAHLPFPSVGRVAVAGDVFRWVPTIWDY